MSKSEFYLEVIGLPENFRGTNLIKQLEQLKIKSRYQTGYKLKFEDFQKEIYHNKFISSCLLLRPLKLEEIACTIAHKLASQRFLATDKKFMIVLEDDAKIYTDINFETITQCLSISKPVILHLGEHTNHMVIKAKNNKKSDTHELLVPPTGTYAYALNRRAAEVLSKTKKDEMIVADWPASVYGKVKFFALKSPIFTHDSEIESIVDKEKVRAEYMELAEARRKTLKNFFLLLILRLMKRNSITTSKIILILIFRNLIFNLGKNKYFLTTLKDYPVD